MGKRLWQFMVASIVAVFASVTAHSNEEYVSYYVSTATGNDATGEGTLSSPWKTITHSFGAIGAAQIEHATLCIASGIYDEICAIPTGVDLSGGYDPLEWSRDLSQFRSRVTSLSSETPLVVDGVDMGWSDVNAGGLWTSPGLILSGTSCAELRNCSISSNGSLEPNKGCGIGLYGQTSGRFIDCEIQLNTSGGDPSIPGSGSEGTGGGVKHLSSGTAEFIQCTFAENGAPYGGAIYANKGTVICRECVFKNNSAVRGASIYGEGDANVIMSNCLFVQENIPTTEIDAHAGVMYNCTVDLRNSVVRVGFGGTIWNSIIRGSGVRYNGDIVYPIYYSNVQRLKGGLGNIDVDPKFVDAANGDYRLLPSSPCIDSGTYTNAPLTDMDGKPRFVDIPGVGGAGHDNSVDMGCYELQLSDWYTPTPTIILSPTSTPASTETPYTPTETPTSTNTPIPDTPTPIPHTPTPTPMLGDLNEDGAVNEKDLLLFLATWHIGERI